MANEVLKTAAIDLRKPNKEEFLQASLRDVDGRLRDVMVAVNPVIEQAANNVTGRNIIGTCSATIYTVNDAPTLNFAGGDDNIEKVIAKIRFRMARRCKQRYARIIYSGGLAVTLIAAGFTQFTFRLYRNGTLVGSTIGATSAATDFYQATFMFVDNLIPLRDGTLEYEYQIRGIKADASGDFSALVQQAAITLDFFRQADSGIV